MGHLGNRSRPNQPRLAQPRRQHICQPARNGRKKNRLLMQGTAPLENVRLQAPVRPRLHPQAQGRCGGLLARRLRPEQKHQPLAAQGADLQAADMLRPGLRQPRQHGSRCIGTDQLLRGPQAFCHALGLDPDQMPCIQTGMHQPRHMRRCRRADQHNRLLLRCEGAEGRTSQAPFAAACAWQQDFGQRLARPATAGQLHIQLQPARRADWRRRRAQLRSPPHRRRQGRSHPCSRLQGGGGQGGSRRWRPVGGWSIHGSKYTV